MPATQAGAEYVASYITGNGGTAFDNTNAQLGVGNGTTVFAQSQTALQGASTLKKGMEAGYPAIDPDTDGSDDVARFAAKFTTAEANFAWEEFGLFNGTDAIMLTRKVAAIGTKTSAAQWTLEVDITFSPGAE